MGKVNKRSKLNDGEWVTKSGTVVTREVEERWSKECEEGFDLSTWTPVRVRVGRPPLDGERVSQRITIRVPHDLHEAASAKAAKEKRSISNLTREALERYVAE
ncbi:MAG: toxin-antitoxin system HicB family antitoxin [Actinobacteria bacterium]|nr:toxin-antitoxin system HicB family antitoxin [Actinomycetota bacterium]